MTTKIRKQITSFLAAADAQIDKALTMVLSLTIAAGASSLVRFTGGNPYNISNFWNMQDGWDPESNYARVLFIIFATVAFYFIIQKLRTRFSPKWFRIFVAVFAAGALFVASTAPLHASNSADMFHYGEQLSPSLDYVRHDKALFTDIFFLHGAAEDILMQSAAFKLFGTSIGSYLLFTYLLRGLCALLFFLLLALIIRSPGYFMFTVIWFLGTSYAGFDYRKNIALYIVLALYYLCLTRPWSLRKRLGGFFAIGLLSSITLLNSIDIGVIMSLTCGLLAVGLLFTERQKDLSRRLQWPVFKKLSTYYESAALAAGGLVAQLGVLLFIGSKAYGEFLRMTVVDIPHFQGLTWDFPLPGVASSTYLFWLPVFLGAFTLYMFVRLVASAWQDNRRVSPELIFAGITLALGLLYLRFGVGRPDEPHVNMSVPVLFVASFYIIQLYVRGLLAGTFKQPDVWVPVLFILLLFWPVTGWNPVRSFAYGNYNLTELKKIRDLPTKDDQAWLSEEQKAVTAFIKDNSSAQDKLFVFNLEPLYYYLTERENPSRFYISWFADPQPYTNELMKELQGDPPKYIIYEGPQHTVVSDRIHIKDRLPEVNKWILENYPTKIKVGETTILTK